MEGSIGNMKANIFQYLKRMATSLLIMVLITIGMATGNTWLRYGSIIVLLVAQMGYQIFKNIRASPLINSNMEEATRTKSERALMDVRENEVSRAKMGVKEGTGLGLSTLALFIVPLVIFIGTGYVLRILVKGIQSWQSYAIGFLVSMPFSLILQARSGIANGPVATPNSYRISLLGVPVGEADIYPERELAINPGQVAGPLQGITVKDPAFGLDGTA